MTTRYGNVNKKSSSIATFTDIASLNINSNIYINIDLDLRQPNPNFRPMLNFLIHANQRQVSDSQQPTPNFRHRPRTN